LTAEVDLTTEVEEILERYIGMANHLDLWMIETEIVLRLIHGAVSEVEEEISMALAEVVDEETLKAAVEEEDEEGGEWAAEDLKEGEVEGEEEVGDSSMVVEVEMGVGQILVEEVEVGTDENPFEEWMTCQCAILKGIDHMTCHHEERDPVICLVMDH